MNILKRLVGSLLFLTLSAFTVSAETPSPDSKLDPMLKALFQSSTTTGIEQAMNRTKGNSAQVSMVRTVVKFTGDLSAIKALGGEIGSIMGDIATIDIPVGSLEALSRIENIRYVEASKRLKPTLDISVPETGAGLLRDGTPPVWSGFTGKDVIVGIVDTGIDPTHPDFKDPTGKTRILYLLDQTTNEECTRSMIDSGTCSERDTVGHGTHVAGIASGNGTASQYRYIGMAPESNLIIVKTTFYTQAILNGISYIEQKAASLGKPCVINLSLGGDIDPHDGTSNWSRGLDNASGPGRILVGAAGNEAGDSIHASGYVAQGSQTDVAFLPLDSPVAIDLWYAGSDQMNIKAVSPDCGDTGWIAPGQSKTSSTSCGNISISSGQSNPNNGDKEIFISITNPRPGNWSFSLLGSAISNGRFDVWSDESAVFLQSDSSVTLSDTGSTTKLISVGSFVTRVLEQDEPPAGAISTFSSLGPRRLCSLCEDVRKPDICAPGQWIMSAFSKDTYYLDQSLQDPSGDPYIMMQGTSMAAPHVSGAVALLLQRNAALSPEEIKSILFSGAKQDSYTGDLPNYVWGHGKLDIGSALSLLAQEAISTPSVAGPSVGATGVNYAFAVGGASSNLGHEVQYVVDWGDGTTSGWLDQGKTSVTHSWTLPGTYVVKAQARCTLHPSVVSAWSAGATIELGLPVVLQSPTDTTPFDACSRYSPPTFSWAAGEVFRSLEIQFSLTSGFDSVPVRVKALSGQAAATLTSGAWKRVLAMPGTSGGTVYWRVVGKRSDKTAGLSGVRSLIIGPPQPVVGPSISTTAKSSLPELSWGNECNAKVRVWFGNNLDFSAPGMAKKAFAFTVKNPGDRGGTSTKQLTSAQWSSIRRLVGDATGSVIYWYVESWDALQRYGRTDVMSFSLAD